MRNSTIYIDASVHGANAHNGYIIGLPSMTSVWGWVHAMNLKAKSTLNDTSLHAHTFSVAYRDYSDLGRCSLSMNEIGYYDYASQGKFSAPIVERPKCNFSVSLILSFHHSEDIDCMQISETISSYMEGSRFAGGLMDLSIVKPCKSLSSAYMEVPNHSFFIEGLNENNIGRDLEVDQAWMSASEKLDALYKLTARKLRFKCRDENTDNYWYIPLVSGYQGVTSPAEKPFSRKGYKHMFAEPVISLYRARLAGSLKNRIRKLGVDNFELSFHSKTTKDAFFVTSKIY